MSNTPETDDHAATATADDTVLRTEGITKRFGGLTAVDDVDVEVHEGEIVGLIGPNGAGKSTLFNCITGTLTADEGRVTLRARMSPTGRSTRSLGPASAGCSRRPGSSAG